ncbi:pyruvate kinase [Gemmata sp. G18]|uniref:Pyruvate kinase n=1 Tax=Gemmata palustris TaxID=2822762 RepID=A0ABS5BVZ6_9BACT|nr:pyruvate kinase [Gemmata palustris]MBP3957873.1 pyruvate kinase [Gemmata palustris]
MTRRTKIVATLGPATDSPDALDAILRAGVDVARVNFSHGAPEEHIGRVANFRAAALRVGKFAAVLADLPGPKLRVKISSLRFLNAGDAVHFSLTNAPVDVSDLVITEPEMLADVRPGHRMLLDDGRLQLEAGETNNGRVTARVVVGGTLHPNKGLNLPDTPLTMGALTERDHTALAVAARAGVDWVAVSFVRGPEAADEVRAACAALGMNVPVLAKIERPEAVGRAGAIVAAFDAIMVARGDLGVELPLERVPTVQKALIAEARAAGKPVITATDMLDSMRNNPRPTRAEASDVANAIFDGTDAVMLSGETAVGSYPVDAVACMHRIAVETESHLRYSRSIHGAVYDAVGDDIDDPITLAACSLADEVNAAAIVTPTLSGRTARLAARNRPWASVVAVAPTDAVLQRLALVWGITPVRMTPVAPGGDRMATAVQDAFEAGTVAAGERVVILAGHPIAGGPRFPTVRVVRVGEGGTSSEP